MQLSDFTELASKNAVSLGSQSVAFVPPALPPDWLPGPEILLLLSQADQAVGRLAGSGQTMANPHLLIRPYARREAVLSSRIEGTQSEYEDAVLFEVEPSQSKAPDANEVKNYIDALEYGLSRVNDLPLSRRLFCEMHERLLASGRGQNRSPGQFRRNQVWIGAEGMAIDAARYVPPPIPQMKRCFDQLEKYLNDKPRLPTLIRLALVHYQIEAIHPFEDGNGRIGRLLIVLMLCKDGILPLPLLYLSAYFEKNRQTYYDLLLAVSTRNAWDEWVSFFLTGVITQANDGIQRATKLATLRDQYHATLHGVRSSSLLLQLVDRLFEQPAITAPIASDFLSVSHTSAMKYLRILESHGIAVEVTGNTRDKMFVAREIIRTTNAPIESL